MAVDKKVESKHIYMYLLDQRMSQVQVHTLFSEKINTNFATFLATLLTNLKNCPLIVLTDSGQ